MKAKAVAKEKDPNSARAAKKAATNGATDGGASNESSSLDVTDNGSTTNVSIDRPGGADLMNMSGMNRKSLGQGSTIKIMQGKVVIVEMPRLLFASTSVKANDLLEENKVNVPERFAPEAIVVVVQWLNEATQKAHMKKALRTESFYKDIHILRAAEYLGVSQYWQHQIQFYRSFLMHKVPSPEEVALIEKLGDSPEDTFVHIVADRFCFLIRKKEEDLDVDKFNDNIPKYPKVQAAMQAINAPYEERQRERREEAARRKAAKAERKAFHQQLSDKRKAQEAQKQQSEAEKAIQNAQTEARRIARKEQADRDHLKRHTYTKATDVNEFPVL
jgi:hypothetical protein